MSRYLFVVPPFFSHVQPTIAIGRELASRGHAVAWVGYAPLRRVLAEGAAFYPIATKHTDDVVRQLRNATGAPWLAGMKALFENILAPMAVDMLPAVDDAIARFSPDALIVDQQTWAGALAARRHGLPWATSATTAAPYDDSLRSYPKVKAWLLAQFDALQRGAGLEPVPWPDTSPSLVILYASRAFLGPGPVLPPHHLMVGPALEGRPEAQDFPWHDLAPGRRVFVSLGTLYAFRGEKFFRRIIEALADAPEQVLLHVPAEFSFAAPRNFIVRPWFPLVQLYPRIDAVVTHAGTTILETFAHGVPAVATPISHDQFIYARFAAASGAARRVSFTRSTPQQLREAVYAVLDQPSYRLAAQSLQQSFREAGGAAAAATAIERLG
ncbi:MAG: glycosyltransferase [Burkholderiales bacterium]